MSTIKQLDEINLKLLALMTNKEALVETVKNFEDERTSLIHAFRQITVPKESLNLEEIEKCKSIQITIDNLNVEICKDTSKVALQNRPRNVDITTEDTVNSKTVAVSTTQKIFARTLSKTEYAEPSNAIIDILETADTGQINKRAVIDKKNASICISRVKDLRHTKLIISSLKWLSQLSTNPLISQRRNPVTTAIFVVRLRKS